MKYILAVDTGGSKTKLCLYSESGELIGTYQTSGAGLAQDSDEDLPHLSKVTNEIASKFNVCAVAVNLGGKNQNQIEAVFNKSFPNAKVRVFRESDGIAALELGKLYGCRAALLAGTGTIAVACDGKGKYIINGGWGANIGDGGSGYSIGLSAIQKSLAALDAQNDLSELEKEITGLDKPIEAAESTASIRDIRDNVRAGLYPLDRKHIASYTAIVTKHAEKGEKDALEIFSVAGRQMGETVVNAVKKLEDGELKSAVISGGLINCLEFWKNDFEKVCKQAGIAEFYYVDNGVMLGTYEIAKKMYKGE